MSHFRRSERASVLLRAELRKGSRDAVLTKSGHISDLSVGGAYIESDSPPSMGERLWVRIVAPTAWEPLELQAEVRWIEAGGFGVRFSQMTQADAAALLALVELAGFGSEAAT